MASREPFGVDKNLPLHDRPRLSHRLLELLVLGNVVIMPFLVTPQAADPFRTPKDVFFQSTALLIFCVLVFRALSGHDPEPPRAYRWPLIVAALATLWTAITSLTAVKPEVAYVKPMTMFCLSVYFAAAIIVTKKRSPWITGAVFAPAAFNALFALVQSSGVAERFFLVKGPLLRLRTTAFIGNPNELGGYFVVPLMAAVAAALAWPGRRRIYAALAIVLCAGVVAAQSITSLVAVVCGLSILLFFPGARAARWIAAVSLAMLVTAASFHPGARARVGKLVQTLRSGAWSEATSFRLPAFGAALAMFRDHPIMGVGPGGYEALYMPYKLQLDSDHPDLIRVGNQNFGQVHNDHLQLLAEAGAAGYLLYWAFIGLVAGQSLRVSGTSSYQKFVRNFAFPGCLALFVLSLGHFPLQLTSTTVPAIYLAAICFTWGESDEVA